MTLDVWTQKSGDLTTLSEGITVDFMLPVTVNNTVTYSVISGKLPPGIILQGYHLTGTPYEVADNTRFTFCIRAKNSLGISDRTFTITVQGPDVPEILTNTGLLAIGPVKQLYVVDNTIVNYQLIADDTDLAAGQQLKFFIEKNSGELPPGLTLTSDGRIVGIVDSVTALTPESGAGTYDSGYYDAAPYDFGVIQKEIGYDVHGFDHIVYDYFRPRQAKCINRRYKFIVSVTDGVVTPRREFEIFVVHENFFRADTDELLSNVGLFTADVSYLLAPVWITPSDLGTYRANNYITLILDVYSIGIIYYSIDNIANLPPGMQFDERTGEVFGYVPYQPAVTTTYSFKVTAAKHGDEDKNESNSSSRTFTIKIIGEIDSVIHWNTTPNLGHIKTLQPSILEINAVSTVPDAILVYSLVGGKMPPGLSLTSNGEITGSVSQLSNQLSFDNNKIIFDSTPTSFDTGSMSFDQGYLSFDHSSKTTFDKKYHKVGLTSFDHRLPIKTTFDHNKTTIDQSFKFTVEAHDQFYYSAVQQTFTINVDLADHDYYDNVIVKPSLDSTNRTNWDNFINDTLIFTPDSLYRPYDKSFGMQTELEMLIYAGIQSSPVTAYIEQMKTNYKNKRFLFGGVKKAIAVIPGTRKQVYEVIYLSMIDPIDSIKNHLSKNTVINNITYYPSSITQWQRSLSLVNNTSTELLPLWMRSIQPNDRVELGYTLAVPLCFCKVGTADQIMLNIKHSNFKFNLLDYSIDRIIIRSTSSYTDKYIIFNNNRNNI